jgi:hypothetical protein
VFDLAGAGPPSTAKIKPRWSPRRGFAFQAEAASVFGHRGTKPNLSNLKHDLRGASLRRSVLRNRTNSWALLVGKDRTPANSHDKKLSIDSWRAGRPNLEQFVFRHPCTMGFEGMPRERSNNISHSTRVDVCALGLVAPELEIRSDDKAQWQALCTRREEAPRCRSAAGTMRAKDRLSYNRHRRWKWTGTASREIGSR